MGDLQLLQDLLLLGSATEQFKITDQRLELVPVLLMPDPMALEWLWVSEVPSILRSEPTLSVKEPQLLSLESNCPSFLPKANNYNNNDDNNFNNFNNNDNNDDDKK